MPNNKPDTQKVGRVLIIAGSDSGGGAGIQADIKTCAAYGVYSSTAITAITAQNTIGVQQVKYLDPELVRAQIQSVMSDIGADVIKIGMLGTADIIEVVAEEIEDADAFIVLDPVMVATSGDNLLDPAAVEMMKTRLLPLADLITPNAPEAERLTELIVTDADDMRQAGEALLSLGCYAALIKGGHLEGSTVIDILVTEEEANMMTSPRLFTRHTHGTGCTLASAVAAGMASGLSLDVAVTEAREFVHEAIRTAPKIGSKDKNAHGPLNHGLRIGDAPAETEPTNNPFAALKGLTDAP